MTVTAALVGAQSPQIVQIVVDAAPAGEAWTVTGTAAGFTWDVSGGYGIGAGEQLVLTDDRTPGNVPITYTFTSESGAESAAPVTVPFTKDVVLQSGDGQVSIAVDLLAGSLAFDFETNLSTFRIPGRPRSVLRYDVVSDVMGAFNILVPVESTKTLLRIIGTGAPIIYRLGQKIVDLDLVGAIALPSISSPTVYTSLGLRVWTLGYELVDDEFQGIARGAFTWDFVDAALAALDWDDVDAFFTGTTWDEIDRYDWSTL